MNQKLRQTAQKVTEQGFKLKTVRANLMHNRIYVRRLHDTNKTEAINGINES